MKITELKCPSCGGRLVVDEKNPAFGKCEYCNSQYAIEWDKEQAFFDNRIDYRVPKQPEKEKDTGWERYGWKRNVLIMSLLVIAIAIVKAPAVYNSWKYGSAETAKTDSGEVADRFKEYYNENIDAFNVEEDIQEPVKEAELSGMLGDMAAAVFGMPKEEIPQAELNKIKWIECKNDWDYSYIGYSFDEPFDDDAELTWLTFPMGSEFEKEGLRLFEGLKKLNLNQRIDENDVMGLHLESIGGYFYNPDEAAMLVEDTSLVRELQFNAGADNLEGIEQFSGLKSLYIDYCELTDLRELVSLPELKKLTVDVDYLSDFSVLGKLSSLEELSISSENLKVLDFIKSMTNLKRLEITESGMISLDGVEEVSSLETLSIEGCQNLNNADAVSGLTNLKELSLEIPYDCRQPDLSALTQLQKLKLSQFEDCSFIKKLSGLESLELDGCNLSAITDLSGLSGLKELTCSSYAAMGEDLGFVTSINSLEKLDIHGVATYDDISGIFNMKNLKYLNLSGAECEIRFSQVQDNQMLESLMMDGIVLYENVKVSGGGGIYSVDWDDVALSEHTDFLCHFKGLKNLSIADNELTDIEFVKDMPVLETVDLSDNFVTQLNPLAELKNLKTVICKGNPVSNERILDDEIILIKN